METRTAGSASGLGKRTSSNAGTAPQADSTQTGVSRKAGTREATLAGTRNPQAPGRGIGGLSEASHG